MAEYRFLTTWLLEAERDRVWDVIHDQESWPSWWRGVVDVVELTPGDENKVGSRARMTWKSFLPYELIFETQTKRVERPHLMEGEVEGELAGIGRWRLYEQDGTTAAVYEWNVRTTRSWMNLLAPIARPVFRWNHDWVMARGAEGIAKRLGCQLIATT
jgi:hypothetical protein